MRTILVLTRTICKYFIEPSYEMKNGRLCFKQHPKDKAPTITDEGLLIRCIQVNSNYFISLPSYLH
jgi:hypothetical protein